MKRRRLTVHVPLSLREHRSRWSRRNRLRRRSPRIVRGSGSAPASYTRHRRRDRRPYGRDLRRSDAHDLHRPPRTTTATSARLLISFRKGEASLNLTKASARAWPSRNRATYAAGGQHRCGRVAVLCPGHRPVAL